MKRIIGIYTITHKTSGHAYLGSSVNIKNRWQNHLSDLRRDAHHSPALQNAYNKYGKAAFEFEVVMTCHPDLLWYYEQQFLDHYKPYYNVSPNVGGYKPGHKVSEETRRKQSEKAKARSEASRANARTAARKANKGERNPAAKLNAKKVLKIKSMIEVGMTNKEVVQTCKCAHKATISNIRRGVQWASVTGWG